MNIIYDLYTTTLTGKLHTNKQIYFHKNILSIILIWIYRVT